MHTYPPLPLAYRFKGGILSRLEVTNKYMTQESQAYWARQQDMVERVYEAATINLIEGVRMFDELVENDDVHEVTYRAIENLLAEIEEAQEKEAIEQAREHNLTVSLMHV